ncbi:MAG: carbohydrate-binding domain-containing protein [Faecalibacterium sp.]|nr:carbohydrate-binding domain-containing protein [Ruminococcus sp.]MCM1392161.1 carbohydrate-binding domain-containing protein [Ruminococcus sp.]MCM1486035.1 carbohydrate-binding domain-containing protein [Faecalibacterium sp.]
MNHKIKIIVSIISTLTLIMSFCGCMNSSRTASDNSTVATLPVMTTQKAQSSKTTEDISIDTYITLDDDKTTIEGNGAVFKNDVLTITKAGTYSVQGSLTDGYIFVNTNDSKKVKLYLNGVSIYSSVNAPIFVENSPKETQLILAEGSINNLSDNANRKVDENSKYATATVYSKDDLQIEGLGTLNITANFNKGIFSKNDIKICGGIINITSTDDAIRGKDSVEITGGTLNLSCGGDAIRTSNETETDKGDILISGGKFNITSSLDAIQAVGNVNISGGKFKIETAGGSTEITATEPIKGFGGGKKGMHPGDSSAAEAEENTRPSTKGIKSGKSMNISGGSFDIDSFDDAFHSNTDLTVSGGTIKIKTNDDALHCETNLTISGGSIDIAQSYEGLEGQTIDVSGGDINIVSADDGINASASADQNENPAKTGGSISEIPSEQVQPQGDLPQPPNGMEPPQGDMSQPQNGMEPPQGDISQPGNDSKQADMHQNKMNNRGGMGGKGGFGGMGDYDSSCQIKISGGKIVINAEGDGVDSNGDVVMNSGTLIVYGPVNGGNGALDYGRNFTVNGGTVLACGSSGMAEGINGGSAASLHFNQKFNANTLCTITDINGNQIISFESPKSFDDVVFSSGKLSKNTEYTIMSGGKNSGEKADGVYQGGSVTDAQKVSTATAG